MDLGTRAGSGAICRGNMKPEMRYAAELHGWLASPWGGGWGGDGGGGGSNGGEEDVGGTDGGDMGNGGRQICQPVRRTSSKPNAAFRRLCTVDHGPGTSTRRV
eukprot:7304141-Prymnesium_polylepis.1